MGKEKIGFSELASFLIYLRVEKGLAENTWQLMKETCASFSLTSRRKRIWNPGKSSGLY